MMDDEELSLALLKASTSRLTDPDQVRALLGHVAEYLLTDNPLSEDVCEWLGWALMAIARGTDPKTALCLQRRGSPAKVSWEQLFPLIHDRIVKGEAWTTVCKDAAVTLGESLATEIDEKTIRLVYVKVFKDWYESWLIEDPVWDNDPPSAAELQSFRGFTFDFIKSTESIQKMLHRSRK